MGKSGTLTVRILGDSKPFERTTSKLGSTVGKFGKVAAAGMVAAAAAAVVVGKKLIDAGERASTSNARIEQIAVSMGRSKEAAKNLTAGLVDLANKTARQTGIDQNAIKATQAKLLTFKELAGSADEVGGAFDRATMAAVDLEAAGFGSAEQNAVALGKALNDPIKGLTALGRSGITFTETEKERIETLVESNKVGEAQAMILGAIEAQVGGTAAATANSTDKMKVAWSQVQERLGQKLMPILDKVSVFVIDTLLPAFERFAERVGELIATHVIPMFQRLQAWWAANGPAILAFVDQLRDGIAAAFEVVIGWIQTVVGWFQQSSDDISGSTSGLLAKITPLWNQIVDVVKSAVEAIQAVVKFVLGVVQTMWDRFGTHILAFITRTVGNLIQVFKGALDVIRGVFEVFAGVFTGDWRRAWDGVKQILSGVWNIIVGVVKQSIEIVRTAIGAAMAAISALWSAAWSSVKAVLAAAWNAIVRAVSSGVSSVISFIAGLPGRAGSALSSLASTLRERARSAFEAMREAAADKVSALLDFVRDIPKRIVSALGNVATLLRDAGRKIIQGLIDGLKSMIGNVGETMRDVTSRVRDFLPFSPAKTGPLSGSGSPEIAGRKIGQMVASGLADESDRVAATMGSLLDGSYGNPTLRGTAGRRAGGGDATAVLARIERLLQRSIEQGRQPVIHLESRGNIHDDAQLARLALGR